MYCHDTHHSGQSPYNTGDLPGVEKWRYKQNDGHILGSPIIGDDDIIYCGGADFYAINKNNSLVWKFDTKSGVISCPTMDKYGIIYFGIVGGYESFIYALYKNGTLSWKYPTGDVYSSPAIGNDGTIYFGDQSQHINALFPNGTLKWRYKTNHVVYSSPAIGDDDTIYCGSHDTYLYALYPNNGSLRWRYKTDHWIRTSPCIADDGTIYVVSLDDYLHAVNPDGSLLWKTNVGAGTSPTIDYNGYIYCGYSDLYCIYPNNGSVRWKYNPGPGRTIRGATPCHSADGITYFGTRIGEYDGGEVIAVNPDGTERWRKLIANEYVDSAPAIASDGTVYIGSAFREGGQAKGYLHAFGKGPLWVEANGPYSGIITQSLGFNGDIYGGIPPYNCTWDFGDGNTSFLEDPEHRYPNPGVYNVTFTVSDIEGNQSMDTTKVTISTPEPEVDITKPVKGLYFRDTLLREFSRERLPLIIGRFTFEVSVGPNYLDFDHVDFYVDDVLQHTDITAPYTYKWPLFTFSTHTIRVTAFDIYGNNISDEVKIIKIF